MGLPPSCGGLTDAYLQCLHPCHDVRDRAGLGVLRCADRADASAADTGARRDRSRHHSPCASASCRGRVRRRDEILVSRLRRHARAARRNRHPVRTLAHRRVHDRDDQAAVEDRVSGEVRRAVRRRGRQRPRSRAVERELHRRHQQVDDRGRCAVLLRPGQSRRDVRAATGFTGASGRPQESARREHAPDSGRRRSAAAHRVSDVRVRLRQYVRDRDRLEHRGRSRRNSIG